VSSLTSSTAKPSTAAMHADTGCVHGGLQIYFYFYSLLRAAVVSANHKRRGLPPVSAGSTAARTEDIGVPASLLVAAVAGAVNMVLTSPAQVCRQGDARAAGALLLQQGEASSCHRAPQLPVHCIGAVAPSHPIP
jgi:hypothetical protein